MSEVFQVPEPSLEALRVYWEFDAPGDDDHARAIRAAYDADIPQIVKQEVERALRWYHARVTERDPLVGHVDPTEQYVSGRFGEPEWHQEPDFVPGAPTERREPSGFREEAHIGHTEHGDRVYAMSGYYIAPDRLAKLERFVTALAEERIAEANIPNTMAYYPDLQRKLAEASESVVSAAREYLR